MPTSTRLLATACLAVFLFAAVGLTRAFAAPPTCLYPGTTARAVKIIGDGPAACALSQCRIVSKQAVKVVPCNSGPACAIGAFYIEIWKAEAGAWGALPACPAWTNTATWQ